MKNIISYIKKVEQAHNDAANSNLQFPGEKQMDSKKYPPNDDVSSNLPRRARTDLWTLAEKKIQDAVDQVETMGADTSLTDAVVLLGQAREKVADFIDGIKLDKSDLPSKCTEEEFNNLFPAVKYDDMLKFAKEHNWIIEEKKDPLEEARKRYEETLLDLEKFSKDQIIDRSDNYIFALKKAFDDLKK